MKLPTELSWPVVEIIRWSEAAEGTVGGLMVNRMPICLTLEPNDRDDNQEGGNSCIEPQEYHCRFRQTADHGLTYGVLDVPGRSAILFHTGNTDAHTKGCILPVTTIGYTDKGRLFMGSSRDAYNLLVEALTKANHGTKPRDFTLRIVKGY